MFTNGPGDRGSILGRVTLDWGLQLYFLFPWNHKTVCKQIVILLFVSISHQRVDSKSPQVSRTLLSILAELNSTVISMVSARRPISNSSNPLTNSLGIVLSAPITIGITVTFMFHSFISSLIIIVIIISGSSNAKNYYLLVT